MTEEAPPQARGVQLDEDLINYEADDIDATSDVEWPQDGKSAGATGAGGETTDLTTSKITVTQTTVDIDDIDWEDHDNTGGDSVEISGDQGLGGLDAGASLDADANAASSFDVDVNDSLSEVPNQADAVAIGAVGDASAFNHDLDVNLGGSTETNDIDEADGPDAVEHEITYDEDDVTAAPQQTEEDLIDYESYPDDPVDQAEEDADAEAQDAEDEGDVQVEDENQIDAAGVEDQSEAQSDEEEGSPVDDGECPEITVTYRNEEFPLFHGQKNFDNQEGFFHDRSILDLTMDQLLRKFRHELTSDLGAQDEVVLQIDEIGLEYAESTQKDHCISVTLRQVHEIFEQLSKNQDPDATRTLYTNLLIRPHPAKRLDLLINEAFNGKGLDDVVYSFQSNHEGRPAAEQVRDVDMYGESSEAEEDASGVQEDEQEPDEEDIPEDEAQEDEDPTSHGDADDGVENQEEDADQDDYDGNAEDEMADMVDLDDDNPHVEDFGQQDFEENDNGLEAMNQPAEDVVDDDAFANADYQADQFAGEGADVNDGDDNAGFELLDFGEDDAVAPEPDQPDRGTTSATVTLNGDGENEISYEDEAVNGTSNHAGGTTGATDVFDEIDWRDGADDGAGISKELGVATAKRPHSEVDVDLNLDDENGVKRRRS